MKNWVIILFLFVGSLKIYAQQTKIISKSFNIEPGKIVEFVNFSGLSLRIVTWDKNEIEFNIKAKVKCSDEEYEKLYINSLDVESKVKDSRQVINFIKTNEKGGVSFLGLFRLRIGYRFHSEIQGEVSIPREMVSKLNFNYADIYLLGTTAISELTGTGNNLFLTDCSGIVTIENNYGKIKLDKCSSDININSISGTIEINDHVGDVKIKSDYTSIKLNNIKGRVGIGNRSGNIEIRNSIVKNLDIPYSKLELNDIYSPGNQVKIKSQSSKCTFNNVQTDFEIEGDYTELKFEKITGDIIFSGRNSKINGNDINGNLDLTTSYSDLILSNLNSQAIKIINSSGDIKLKLNSEPIQVYIVNRFNLIDVKMPPGFNGEIDLETQYGNIKSDLIKNIKSFNNTTTGYAKGNSEKKRVKIRNLNSDIYFYKQNDI